MKTWFKFTFPNGCTCWVYSRKGWGGLIPYSKMIPEQFRNDTTMRQATRWESFMCWLKNFFGDIYCIY